MREAARAGGPKTILQALGVLTRPRNRTPVPLPRRKAQWPAGCSATQMMSTEDELLQVNCGRCGQPLLVRVEAILAARTVDCAECDERWHLPHARRIRRRSVQ